MIITRCDVCGTAKGESNHNHWLLAITEAGFSGIMFVPSEASDRNALCASYEDICGQACAHKRLSQFLESQ